MASWLIAEQRDYIYVCVWDRELWQEWHDIVKYFCKENRMGWDGMEWNGRVR